MWEALCRDTCWGDAGGHHLWGVWSTCGARQPRRPDGKHSDGAQPGVGSGGNHPVRGEVYMGEYLNRDHRYLQRHYGMTINTHNNQNTNSLFNQVTKQH